MAPRTQHALLALAAAVAIGSASCAAQQTDPAVEVGSTLEPAGVTASSTTLPATTPTTVSPSSVPDSGLDAPLDQDTRDDIEAVSSIDGEELARQPDNPDFIEGVPEPNTKTSPVTGTTLPDIPSDQFLPGLYRDDANKGVPQPARGVQEINYNQTAPEPNGCWLPDNHPNKTDSTPSTTLTAPVGTIETGRYCGPGSMAWRYKTGGIVSSSADIADGILYIGSRDGNLYALDTNTGAPIWISTDHHEIDTIPEVADGKVFFGQNKGQLFALDAKTGDTIWMYQETEGGIFQSSPLLHDGVLYSGGGGAKLRAFDIDTGEVLWQYNADMWVQSSVAIAGDTAYVGSDDGYLHAVDIANGQLRWRFAAILPDGVSNDGGPPEITPDGPRSNVLSTPRFWGDNVYITSVGTVVYGVDATDGTAVWAAPTERHVSDMWAHNGDVYSHSDIGLLRSYDAQTGQLNWAARTGSSYNDWSTAYQTASGPIASGNTVYVGGTDGHLSAFDTQTGELRWAFRTDGWIMSSPRLDGDKVFVGSNDGWIYAIYTR